MDNLRTNEVQFPQSQQPQGIAWRGRRDLTPRLPSNIIDLTPKSMQTNADKMQTNRKERMGDFIWRVSDCEELVGVSFRR